MRKVVVVALALVWSVLSLVRISAAAPPLIKVFVLKPNPKFGPCAQRFSTVPLGSEATVAEGPLNDTLTLRLANFKPGLAFDLFTIQFHVGIWFNNPADATACGFTGTTPFNGEHNAGPNAMITVPSATTGLGPLCLNPSTTPGKCNP